METHKIILSHIVTERTTNLREANNEYVFKVDRSAGKHRIREAIQDVFNVKVDSVRTMTMPGKIKRMGRFAGKRPAWKKAIVRLKTGEVITMFENV